MLPIVPEAVYWAALTLGLYGGARWVHRRYPRWWASPLLVTWLGCAGVILALHAKYEDYLAGTRGLVLLLGPATVAFAVPIHRHREMVRRHWRVLGMGVVAGSLLAVGSSWLLAGWFGFSPDVRASLLPRSVTTPLAMAAASRIGGTPELTAGFTAVTGLFGAAVGELLLVRLPFRSSFARGALFGMGAHGAGVAKARELGAEEGVVASLVMILAGLLNVMGAAVYAAW
ncbi:putative effector of murein hydrolase [Haloferula luteola]|uniref:Putative effector of murein hydrolase n=1 Tax=Haloferula luteola TaxID=595692 RepID=A0A840VEE9_9BACT|nr:LrgB family protein [Haloferula luteola]MBB5353018.1 putative effector of murein hydrolase [Haloferula luteola]